MKSYTFFAVMALLVTSVLYLLALSFSRIEHNKKGISMCFDSQNSLLFLGYSKQIPKFKKRIVKSRFEIKCIKSSMTTKDWYLLKNAKNKEMIFK